MLTGGFFEAFEVTPSGEQRGKKGFPFRHLDKAMQRFEEMCQRRERSAQ